VTSPEELDGAVDVEGLAPVMELPEQDKIRLTGRTCVLVLNFPASGGTRQRTGAT